MGNPSTTTARSGIQRKVARPVRWALFFLVFGAILQEAPGIVFSHITQYERSHPLLVQYYNFMRATNLGILAALVLSLAAPVRALLFHALTALFLFEFSSGFWLAVVEKESFYAYRLASLHLWAGQLVTPLFSAYLIRHVYEWGAAVPRRETAAGLFVAFLIAEPIVAGAIWSILGGPEMLAIFQATHAHPSLLIPVFLAIHIKTSQSPKIREKRIGTPPAHSPAITRASAAFAAGAAAVLMLLPQAALQRWGGLEVRAKHQIFDFLKPPSPVPEMFVERPGYTYSKAGSPFHPSNVKVEGGGFLDPEYFQQGATCGYMGCHVDIYTQWSRSAHRHSINPFFVKVRDAFEKKHGVEAARLCAACHDPASLISGSLYPGGNPVSGSANEGVACTVCHTISRVDATAFNGSYTIAPAVRFFERRLESGHYIMVVSFLDSHKRELSRPLYKENDYCGACHNFSLPEEFNPIHPIHVNLSADWEKSVQSRPDGPKGIQTCVECHLPPFLEQYQNSLVRSHQFLSSNTAVPWRYGEKEHLSDAQNMLKSGVVTLDVAADPKGGPFRPGETARFNVTVRNVEVGHGFPAGLLNLVQVWVEMEVKGAGNAAIWKLGQRDGDGNVPKDTIWYGTEIFDPRGAELKRHEFWEVGEVRNPRRLLGGQSETRSFSFLVPYGERGPLKMTARLRHRRFKPDFARWVLGEDEKELPVTDMRTVEAAWPVVQSNPAPHSIRTGRKPASDD